MTRQSKLDKFVWVIFLCILLINFVLLVNTKFTLWPEMMVYPYLLKNGFILYRDLINPYPPTVTYLLALVFSLFRYSVNSYQTFTWSLISLSTVIVFFVTSKIFDNKKMALVSMSFFSLFSLLYGINGLWFDLIQTPIVLTSVYFFAKFVQNKKNQNLDLSFLFATIAVLLKQQAVWLIFFYCITLIAIYRHKVKDLPIKLIKTFTFIALVTFFHLVIFYRQGTLPDFINWVILFPLKASSQEGYFSPPTVKQYIVVLATFGLFLPILIRGKKLERVLFSCAITLSLFSYPRFDYFHLIPALAVLAVIFGKNISLVHKTTLVSKAVTVICLIFILATTCRYIATNWQTEVRFFESDIISSATLLAITVPQGQKVYVQNGPDQLLPLSGTLPPKPWADEFPWYLENNNMQERVISSLENDRPTYVVYKPYDDQEKYMLGTYQPEKISNYINKYYSNYFQMSDTLWLKKINNDL